MMLFTYSRSKCFQQCLEGVVPNNALATRNTLLNRHVLLVSVFQADSQPSCPHIHLCVLMAFSHFCMFSPFCMCMLSKGYTYTSMLACGGANWICNVANLFVVRHHLMRALYPFCSDRSQLYLDVRIIQATIMHVALILQEHPEVQDS